MGIRDINDDHAADLTNVQEMRGVVDRLRQLYAATFDAATFDAATFDQAREDGLPPASEERPETDDQSTTGR